MQISAPTTVSSDPWSRTVKLRNHDHGQWSSVCVAGFKDMNVLTASRLPWQIWPPSRSFSHFWSRQCLPPVVFFWRHAILRRHETPTWNFVGDDICDSETTGTRSDSVRDVQDGLFDNWWKEQVEHLNLESGGRRHMWSMISRVELYVKSVRLKRMRMNPITRTTRRRVLHDSTQLHLSEQATTQARVDSFVWSLSPGDEIALIGPHRTSTVH